MPVNVISACHQIIGVCVHSKNTRFQWTHLLLMTRTYFKSFLVAYRYCPTYLKSHYSPIVGIFECLKPTWVHFEIVDSQCRCATIHKNHDCIDVSPFDVRNARSFKIYASEEWFGHHQTLAHQTPLCMGDTRVVRVTNQYVNLVIYRPG